MSTDEIKTEVPVPPDNGKVSDYPKEPSDFKVAEIWVKKSQLIIEAPRDFWLDQIRAIGILEYCKDIVKNPKAQKEEKSKIISSAHGMMEFVRKNFRKKK